MHQISSFWAAWTVLVAVCSFAHPARAEDGVDLGAPTDISAAQGFHDDSSAGISIVTGNSSTQTYDLKQKNTYGWDMNFVKFDARYLENEISGVTKARYWDLGLRYERELSKRFSGIAGESLESDPFSGYLQRYNTDIGGKYQIYQEKDFGWSTEAGYRYRIENRPDGMYHQNLLRVYTELNANWTKSFSSKYWLEILPNLTTSSDYQINTEISGSADINSIFAIKVAYLVKYRNDLVANAITKTDTQYSTALVAKF